MFNLFPKTDIKLIVAFLSVILVTSQCLAASENIQKIPDKEIYVDDIKTFMADKFTSNLTPDMSEWQTIKTSMEDGWNAFNVNFNVQGGTFTIFEEFLSMGFLKNINEMCGKVGGGLIIGQLAIDLLKGDIISANTNLAKNSLSRPTMPTNVPWASLAMAASCASVSRPPSIHWRMVSGETPSSCASA